MKVSMGITNAAVLPEPGRVSSWLVSVLAWYAEASTRDRPVSAIPMMSRFCRPIGIA